MATDRVDNISATRVWKYTDVMLVAVFVMGLTKSYRNTDIHIDMIGIVVHTSLHTDISL